MGRWSRQDSGACRALWSLSLLVDASSLLILSLSVPYDDPTARRTSTCAASAFTRRREESMAVRKAGRVARRVARKKGRVARRVARKKGRVARRVVRKKGRVARKVVRRKAR